MQQYSVTIDIEGQGSMQSGDGMIACGDDCNKLYAMGSLIELAPVPDNGWFFVGWQGSPDCGGEAIISGNIDCKAIFGSADFVFEDGFEQ